MFTFSLSAATITHIFTPPTQKDVNFVLLDSAERIENRTINISNLNSSVHLISLKFIAGKYYNESNTEPSTSFRKLLVIFSMVILGLPKCLLLGSNFRKTTNCKYARTQSGLESKKKKKTSIAIFEK